MCDLSRWCLAHYQALKDFAAPAATVIGAGAAVIVTGIITWTLGKRQVAIAQQQAVIARQQADTALDRLRYDLFEKRYAIYVLLTQLIEAVCDGTTKGVLPIDEIAAKVLPIEEARFFFLPDMVKYIFDIRQKCDRIMDQFAQHRTRMLNEPDVFPLPKELWNEVQRLRQELPGLPQRFERDMGFAHVLRPSTVAGRPLCRELGTGRQRI